MVINTSVIWLDGFCRLIPKGRHVNRSANVSALGETVCSLGLASVMVCQSRAVDKQRRHEFPIGCYTGYKYRKHMSGWKSCQITYQNKKYNNPEGLSHILSRVNTVNSSRRCKTPGSSDKSSGWLCASCVFDKHSVQTFKTFNLNSTSCRVFCSFFG